MAELGITHRASLNLRFGKNRLSRSLTENSQEYRNLDVQMSKAAKSSASSVSKQEAKSEKKEGLKTGTIFDVFFKKN